MERKDEDGLNFLSDSATKKGFLDLLPKIELAKRLVNPRIAFRYEMAEKLYAHLSGNLTSHEHVEYFVKDLMSLIDKADSVHAEMQQRKKKETYSCVTEALGLATLLLDGLTCLWRPDTENAANSDDIAVVQHYLKWFDKDCDANACLQEAQASLSNLTASNLKALVQKQVAFWNMVIEKEQHSNKLAGRFATIAIMARSFVQQRINDLLGELQRMALHQQNMFPFIVSMNVVALSNYISENASQIPPKELARVAAIRESYDNGNTNFSKYLLPAEKQAMNAPTSHESFMEQPVANTNKPADKQPMVPSTPVTPQQAVFAPTEVAYVATKPTFKFITAIDLKPLTIKDFTKGTEDVPKLLKQAVTGIIEFVNKRDKSISLTAMAAEATSNIGCYFRKILLPCYVAILIDGVLETDEFWSNFEEAIKTNAKLAPALDNAIQSIQMNDIKHLDR